MRSARKMQKGSFYDELVIFYAIKGEVLLIGDFNARAGSRLSSGIGLGELMGFGSINDTGKELLSFLSIHQASVCKSWFPKKSIHKITWKI